MTRNEYLIDLLMESADALMESAGRNGAARRSYSEMKKNILNGQDYSSRLEPEDYATIDINERHARDMYNKARKGDKNANRLMAIGSKQSLDGYNRRKKDYLEKYDGRNMKIHDKINQRAEFADWSKRMDERIKKNQEEKMMEERRKKLEKRQQLRRQQRIENLNAKNEAIDILAEATDIMYGEY